MPRIIIFHLLMWLPLTVSAASATHNQPLASCETSSGDDAIIVYDSLGGMKPRTGKEPLFSLHTSGKVILGNPYGSSRRIESRLDYTQVQRLLDFIVEQSGFFDIDAAAIQLQIREAQNSSGRLFAIADAGESIMRVCAKERHKEVKFYALSHAARQFPEIPALQRLYAIEQELKRTATRVRIGGDTGAKAVLASVNKHLSRNHPQIEPLTLDNLTTAFTGQDGNLTVYFSRRGFEQQGARMRNISAIVYYPFGQKNSPVITVNLE